MSYPVGGRHELGQNFLMNQTVISAVVALVARTHGPIVEIGSGDGALTLPMSRLGRPITALELHPGMANRLAGRAPAQVTVRTADALTYQYPQHPHVVVGNLPFHLTTRILRMLLALEPWTDAVLVAQWEVARRRAGVGGATLLTASWWPWFEFVLHQRISRSAFRPAPSVDGGLFSIHRRAHPLVSNRGRYQAMVRTVFAARGRGLGEILPRSTRLSRSQAIAWLADQGLAPSALPRDLNALHWAELFGALAGTPRQPGNPPGREERRRNRDRQ